MVVILAALFTAQPRFHNQLLEVKKKQTLGLDHPFLALAPSGEREAEEVGGSEGQGVVRAPMPGCRAKAGDRISVKAVGLALSASA